MNMALDAQYINDITPVVLVLSNIITCMPSKLQDSKDSRTRLCAVSRYFSLTARRFAREDRSTTANCSQSACFAQYRRRFRPSPLLLLSRLGKRRTALSFSYSFLEALMLDYQVYISIVDLFREYTAPLKEGDEFLDSISAFPF